MPRHPSSHPLSYRRIAVSFTVLVLLLTILTLTLTLARATITITPHEEPQMIEVVIRVETAPEILAADVVPGTVTSHIVTLEGKATVTEGTSVPEPARGIMTVINNYTRNQPLVATTRFLSDKGVLFRTTRTITVPAGGRTTVAVRADKAGVGGEVPPGKFTIPGLWAGLQDQIYGVTDKPMTGGTRNVTRITKEDLARARASLASNTEAHLYELRSARKGSHMVVALVKEKEQILTPVAREADAARVQAVYREVVVAYDREALNQLLTAQLKRRAEFSARIETQEPKITFDRLTDAGVLLLVKQPATIVSPVDKEKINTRLLAGKKIAEATRILKTMPGVGDVAITLKPKFLKRLPRLRNHIKIIISED